jgi:hypothetical protein
MARIPLRLTLVLLLAVLLLAAAPALAKGPADKVIIAGPDVDGIVEITDPALLRALGMGTLENLTAESSAAPENLGPGYGLTRFFRTEEGRFQPFDHVVYYPDLADGRGYIYYDGLSVGWSELDGGWYRVSEIGEWTLQRILAGDTPAQISQERLALAQRQLVRWILR